jgi:hypothetical protein
LCVLNLLYKGKLLEDSRLIKDRSLNLPTQQLPDQSSNAWLWERHFNLCPVSSCVKWGACFRCLCRFLPVKYIYVPLGISHQPYWAGLLWVWYLLTYKSSCLPQCTVEGRLGYSSWRWEASVQVPGKVDFVSQSVIWSETDTDRRWLKAKCPDIQWALVSIFSEAVYVLLFPLLSQS